MNNVINNGLRGVGEGTAQRGPQQPQGPQSGAAGNAGQSDGQRDQLRLSGQLEQLRQSAAQVPEVNEARVAEIRSAIAEGRYPVDAEAIADKFLEFEGLLGR